MPRYLLGSLLALTVVAAVSSRARAAGETTVAVLGIEPIDVPPELAQQLTVALLQRVSSSSGLRLVQGKDLMEMKMIFGCDGEAPSCMAQAGRSLGADKLLYGTLKKSGGAHGNNARVQVALKVLDVKTATLEKTV